MDKTVQSSSKQKMYHLSLFQRLLPPIICLSLLLYMLVLFSQSINKINLGAVYFLVIVSSFLVILAAFLYVLANNVHIVIAPEGITYCGYGARIYTPWENIAGIKKVMMGAYKIECLELRLPASRWLSIADGIKKHQPVLEKSRSLTLTQDTTYLTTIVLFIYNVFTLNISEIIGGIKDLKPEDSPDSKVIPVGLFRDWKNGGDMWSDIFHYIPHILSPD